MGRIDGRVAEVTGGGEGIGRGIARRFAAGGARVLMGRMGDPEDDIAPVALFLASDDCAYLTDNTLFVDGGSHINRSNWAPDLPD